MDAKELRAWRKIYDWARNRERPGGEFDWFAVDDVGHVAAFCTAGFGAVPDAVFEPSWSLFRDFVIYLAQASPKSEGLWAYENQKLFVYDYGDWTKGIYSQLVIPDDPLRLDEIPSELRVVPEAVRLSGKFDQVKTLCAEDHWPCR